MGRDRAWLAALREDLTVTVPAERGPGTRWAPGPPVDQAELVASGPPIRIGYARCSTAEQDLDAQITALETARCRTILSEKISSRIKLRPEFEKALTLARQFKEGASEQAVILTVHEFKRPARHGAELMPLAADLQSADIQLNCSADRSPVHPRETLEGQQIAATLLYVEHVVAPALTLRNPGTAS